nr:carboxypeptidase-like regulatory domain-containing protein [uncultured Allomuricauda sp.]
MTASYFNPLNIKISIVIMGFCAVTTYAQTFSGRVLESNSQKPIQNVNILLKDSKTGTVTNSMGSYSIKFDRKPKRRDSLLFSSIGYAPKAIAIKDLVSNGVVYLTEKIEQLDEVNVSANKLERNLEFKKLTPMERGIHNFGSFISTGKIYVVGGDASIISNTDTEAFKDVAQQWVAASANSFRGGSFNYASFQQLLLRAYSNDWLTHESYSDNIRIYDIASDTWETQEADLKGRAYGQAVLHNDHIYTFGGKTLSRNRKLQYLDNTIEVYNLEEKSIQVDETNPHRAVNFASFYYNGRLIMMGGSTKEFRNGKKKYNNKIHFFNFEKGLWYELGHMPVAKETTGIRVENKLYLIGGENKKALKDIESYDLETGKWNKEGQLFMPLMRPALATSGNIIYIYEYGKIWTFNTETKEMDEYSINLDLKSAQLYVHEDKIYLLGGYSRKKYVVEPSREIYSIDLSQFERTRVFKSKVL